MYKAAVIGAGRIAWELSSDSLRRHTASHIQAINNSDDIILDSVCDISELQLQKFSCSEHFRNNISFFNESGHIYKYTEPEIVVICSDSYTHFHKLKECMLYASENLKAVICEKPVVLSLEELLKIKELIIQRQISLYVNHTRRYNRNYRMIHEIIRSGKLGELTQINGYINAGGQSFKGEGPLLHDGIHLIDIINYLHGGLPENIYVRTEKQDSIECNVNCYYNTDSDVDVYINLASDKGFFYFGLELYFEKGKIRIGNHEFSVEKTAPSSRYSGFIETEKIRPEEIIDIMKISKKDFFTTLYEEVCENLRESIFSTKDLETSQLSHYMIDLMLGADNHGKVIIPDLSFL